MSKTAKRLTIVVVVFAGLIAASLVNLFLYPFTSADPNFSDVERVFNKIQIPADWVEISSSENRGIAGRACPVEPGSACFHKSKTHLAPSTTSLTLVGEQMSKTGCPLPVPTKADFGDGKESYELVCSVEGLDIVGNIRYLSGGIEVYITVRT